AGRSAAFVFHTPHAASCRYVVRPTTGRRADEREGSEALEATAALPVGDGRFVGGELHVRGIHVVADDVLAERVLRQLRVRQQIAGAAQVGGQALRVAGVRAALGDGRQLQLVLDAVDAGRDEGGGREVG